MTVWSKGALAGCTLALILAAGAQAGPFEDAAQAASAGDYVTARSLYTPLAEAGNGSAQFNLGILYDQGRGGLADPIKAKELFSLAAAQGVPKAEYNLATFLRDGRGGPVDLVKARELYLKSAQHGFGQAAFNLGVFYASGQGGPVDYQKAREWFEKAGSAESVAYVEAKIAGARGDHAQERLLLAPIAKDGKGSIAQYDLGMLLVTGQGGPVDLVEGRRWLQTSADRGYAPARVASQQTSK